MPNRMLKGIALLGISALATGCVSPWEEHFEPSGGVSLVPLEFGPPVRVREVPWERIDDALAELEREVIESDTHPSEWSLRCLAERDERLLTALQYSEPPEDVLVLGRSVFFSVDPAINPGGRDMISFAEKIGATDVAWTNRYEGKTQIVTKEPVTTTGFAYESGGYYGHRRGRHGGSGFSYTETTYVPVVVEADEYAWMAYFLRIRP